MPSALNNRNWYNCTVRGSYGLNSAVRNDVDVAPLTLPHWHMPRWKTSLVKGANNVPVFLDSWRFRGDVVKSLMGMTGIDKPPAHEVSNTRGGGHFGFFCINRHDGGINGLFMDWSVRRVGLKELWTLKWQRNFNTAGPWTKAGGVRPEDWPEWMRKFKDY